MQTLHHRNRNRNRWRARYGLSGPDVGDGPELDPSDAFALQALCLDSARNRVLVASDDLAEQAASLIAVDLSTGDRELVSDISRGRGPELTTFSGVALAPAAPSVFAVSNGSVLTVDLDTGDRAILSTAYAPARGLGPPLTFATRAVFDSVDGILVVSSGNGFVAGVRLDNGNRGLISGRDSSNGGSVGLGPALRGGRGLVLDSHRPLIYVADYLRGSVTAIDRTTGDRVLVAR